MDSHFHDISLGLYEQGSAGKTSFLVHTYSRRGAAADRVGFVNRAMIVLGGLAMGEERLGMIRFVCGQAHRFACRRVFLESCKLASDVALEAAPLAVYDKKSDQMIEVTSRGEGRYLLSAGGDAGVDTRRAAVAALGLVKLGELEPIAGTSDQVRFTCGTEHDDVVGLLLTRALNVRTAMREIEAQASRGMLAAPSAQGT